jgi:hypothetical protein
MSEDDFSTLQLPIKPGVWVDADERMFHACFTILGQYVDGELGGEPSVEIDKTAIALWRWYRNELPGLEEREPPPYTHLDDLKDQKLKELIAIRRHLWM